MAVDKEYERKRGIIEREIACFSVVLLGTIISI